MTWHPERGRSVQVMRRQDGCSHRCCRQTETGPGQPVELAGCAGQRHHRHWSGQSASQMNTRPAPMRVRSDRERGTTNAIERRNTTSGQSPYAGIDFRLTTSKIRNPDGSVVFRLEVGRDLSDQGMDALAIARGTQGLVPLGDQPEAIDRLVAIFPLHRRRPVVPTPRSRRWTTGASQSSKRWIFRIVLLDPRQMLQALIALVLRCVVGNRFDCLPGAQSGSRLPGLPT